MGACVTHQNMDINFSDLMDVVRKSYLEYTWCDTLIRTQATFQALIV